MKAPLQEFVLLLLAVRIGKSDRRKRRKENTIEESCTEAGT